MLVGIVAEAEHGKTTIADYLVEHTFIKMSFADPLKQMLIIAGMCTHDECYIKKTKQSRWLLQKVGTDIFRNQLDNNYWTKRMKEQIEHHMAKNTLFPNIVVDDIRMPNEAKLIKKIGGTVVKVIRFNRNGTIYKAKNTNQQHDSENLVKSISADFTIEAKSGEIDKLEEGIEFIVNGGEPVCDT